eukprot:SAG11_NODE_7711_length_1097_cov_0.630586_1_plen_272_part_00
MDGVAAVHELLARLDEYGSRTAEAHHRRGVPLNTVQPADVTARSVWTAEQRARLHHYAGQGAPDWSLIAARIPGHTAIDCCTTWCEDLAPQIHLGPLRDGGGVGPGGGGGVAAAAAAAAALEDEKEEDEARSIEECRHILQDLQTRWVHAVSLMPSADVKHVAATWTLVEEVERIVPQAGESMLDDKTEAAQLLQCVTAKKPRRKRPRASASCNNGAHAQGTQPTAPTAETKRQRPALEVDVTEVASTASLDEHAVVPEPAMELGAAAVHG